MYGKFTNHKIRGGGGWGTEVQPEPHHLVFFRVRSIKVALLLPILKNFIIDKALRTRFRFDN